MHHDRRNAFGATFTLLAASAATLVTLVVSRPHLAVGPALRSGDDLAIGSAWLAAVACAAWLTVTAGACAVALVHGRPGVAARIASFGPPLARRIMQTALAGAFAVLPATTLTAPAKPLVVRVGAGGRLTSVPGENPRADTPVVRAPSVATRPAVPSTRPTPTTTRSMPAVPPPAAPSEPGPAVRRIAATRTTAPRTSAPRTYVVQPGDNLWRIAWAETARATGVAHPDNRVVAGYWDRVIATNRTTLRSGDPSLIFAGEVVALPAF